MLRIQCCLHVAHSMADELGCMPALRSVVEVVVLVLLLLLLLLNNNNDNNNTKTTTFTTARFALKSRNTNDLLLLV